MDCHASLAMTVVRPDLTGYPGNQRSGQGPLAYYAYYLEKTTFTSE